MLDLKTIVFCSILINLSLCLPFWITWRYQKVYAGFGWWVLANISLVLGYIFMVLLRDHIPLRLSLPMTFLFFPMAAYLRFEGLLRFFGRESRWYIHGAVLFAIPLLIVAIPLEFGARTALMSAVLAYYLLGMTRVVFSQAQGGVRKLYLLLAIPFFIYGVFLASRCAFAFIAPAQVEIPQNTTTNLIFFSMAMLLDIAVPLNLLMLNEKRVAMELGATERRLNLTIEATRDGLWDWDFPSGKAVFSPHVYTMLGFEPYEFPQTYAAWHSLVHPDDNKGMERDLRGPMVQNNFFSREIRVRTKSGDWNWILVRGRVIEGDDTRQAIRMVGTFSNITDRKRAELDKENLLGEIQLLLDSTEEGIFGVDTAGRCTFINKSGTEMTGYSKEEMIGQDIHCLIHSSPADESADNRPECPMASTLLEGGKIHSDEEIIWRKNGTFFPVTYSSFPVIKEDQIRGAVVTFTDKSETKRVEGILRETEKRYQELVENANSVIIRWNRDGLLTFINEYGLSFFGYRYDEIIGKSLGLIVPARGTSGGDLSTLIQDTLNHPERFVNNINENVCREGRRVWMAWTNRPILDGKGEVVEILAVGSDITSLKEAEEKIRNLNEKLEQRVKDRTRELELANQELESFSYSVSHDLQAPLRHIDGFSLALLEDYSDKLDDAGKEFLERIRQGAQRMGFLINDLLKLSRVSRYEFKYEAVDLSRLVRTIAEELRQNSPGREVDLIIQEGLVGQGDPYLLKIAIGNLLENAWKFSGRAEKARIEFGSDLSQGKNDYFIKDNGIGFDMTYVDKLFNPFQRLHNTRDFPGTGIGLVTVKRIITRLGGQVRAEGEVGRGAAFYFILPQKEIAEGRTL